LSPAANILVTGNSRCHAFDADLPATLCNCFPESRLQIGAKNIKELQNRIHDNYYYRECYFFDLIPAELSLSAASLVFTGFASTNLVKPEASAHQQYSFPA